MAQEATIARVYAETLLRRADRLGELEAVDESLTSFDEVLGAEARLRRFLTAPQVPSGEKQALLENVFADRLHPEVLGFLDLVVDKHREAILPEIGDAWRRLLDERAGRRSAVVSTAVAIDDDTLAKIRGALEDVTGKTIVIRQEVESELIGGVVIRTGDTVIDGSVKRRLAALGRRWKAAGTSHG